MPQDRESISLDKVQSGVRYLKRWGDGWDDGEVQAVQFDSDTLETLDTLDTLDPWALASLHRSLSVSLPHSRRARRQEQCQEHYQEHYQEQ